MSAPPQVVDILASASPPRSSRAMWVSVAGVATAATVATAAPAASVASVASLPGVSSVSSRSPRGPGLAHASAEASVPRVARAREENGGVVDGSRMLERCLKGDPVAVRKLVDEWTPVIQARAARAILRRRAHREQRRGLEQEVEELTQEVFASLFADDARALRAWDPARGLSLKNFVGLLAEREIANILQSGRRRPWSEDRTVDASLEDYAGVTPDAEAPVAARELFGRIFARLQQELSPQGLELFQMLLVEERAVEDVCAATGLSRDAVYAWRSRLPKLVRRLASEIST
jgi:DNA-directed RNA polymerase specialized sigma24 family protein